MEKRTPGENRAGGRWRAQSPAAQPSSLVRSSGSNRAEAPMASDEEHRIETILEPRRFIRPQGEALHPDREPLEVLDRIRTGRTPT